MSMKHEILSTALLFVLAVGCTNRGKQEKGAATTESTQARSRVQARWRSRQRKQRWEVRSHQAQDDRGFYEAMTMSYPVPETSDLEKVHPGDHITATVYHDPLNNRFWVGNMQVETGTHL
jgi:Copper binding periplasmic protein CusF